MSTADLQNRVEVDFHTESAFAQDSTSYSGGKRVPVTSPPAENLPQQRVLVPANDVRAAGGIPAGGRAVRSGPRSGTFTIESYLCGTMLTAPADGTAVPNTWLSELIGYGLGGNDGGPGVSAKTLSGTHTTAQFQVADTTGIEPGSIIWLGAQGDGRGDGRAYHVKDVPSSTVVQIQPSVAVAPINGDKVHFGRTLYHQPRTQTGGGSSGTFAHQSLRFMIGRQGTGNQNHYRGAAMQALRIGLPLGEVPTVSMDYAAAHVKRSAVTVPSASLDLEDCFAAPVDGGAMTYWGDTTLRAELTQVRDVELTLDLQVLPIESLHGAVNSDQTVVGWIIAAAIPTLRFRVPADAATPTWESWWDTEDPTSADFTKGFMLTATRGRGRLVAICLPKTQIVGMRPQVSVDTNGLTYHEVTVRGLDLIDDDVSTDDLYRSAFKLGLG